MCTQYSHQAACKTAQQLGATVEESGYGWTRADGFPSAEVAWYFQTEFNGMDTVGAFPEESGEGYAVYFR
jgi:hypothetical protein